MKKIADWIEKQIDTLSVVLAEFSLFLLETVFLPSFTLAVGTKRGNAVRAGSLILDLLRIAVMIKLYLTYPL